MAETDRPNQKERLELLEKKVGIQKVKVEILKEKININLEKERNQFNVDQQKINLEKISELRSLLSDFTIDEDRTVFGNEPLFKMY